LPAQSSPSITTPDLAAAARAARSDTGATTLTHLSVEGISKSFGERRVLSDVSFTAKARDRVGLIGENGTGKSTLLRLLAGAEEPDAGAVRVPGTVGLLAQELPYPDDAPLGRVLDDAQRPALDVLVRIERLGASLADHPGDARIAADYASSLEEAERSDAWSAEAQRGETVSGLGLGGIPASRPIGHLSGGQRLRLALAAILLEAPHTLLLDEPSNHLDDASAAYLERVLVSWPGIVIVASHDRALLDAVTTRILDLDPLPLVAAELADAASPETPAPREARETLSPAHAAAPAEGTDDTGSGMGARLWGVGYSAARAERRAEMERWRSRYAAETEERGALRHEIEVGSREVNRKHESKSEAKITRKFYADKDARVTSRRARNARVRLEALERDRVRRPPEPLRFAGFASRDPAAGKIPNPEAGTARESEIRELRPEGHLPILRAERVGLAGRLAPISVELETRGRIMLTGPNGSGKSTLLAILSSALEPDTGAVVRGPGAALGFLPQEVSFENPALSAADAYRDAVGADIAAARPLAATGLLAPRDVDRAIGALSVGQRRRVALAMIVADPPDILLLDEPTNHLSLTLVEELEEALRTFRGALVIATHDRWLRSRWEGEVLPLS